MRGEAYLTLRDGKAAAAELQKFVDHRGLVANFPWGALARLGLARAYAVQGNTTSARSAYQDFLTLWKDADPEIPIRGKRKPSTRSYFETSHIAFSNYYFGLLCEGIFDAHVLCVLGRHRREISVKCQTKQCRKWDRNSV